MSLRNSLERSKTPPITAKRGGKMMAVRIQLLDDSINLFQVQQKANGRVLFEQVCRQLSLLEADYFGLEYEDATGIKYWLDLDKPMNCQLGLSMMDPLLRFCVKFYTPDPAQLEEEYTRYLFCLQIKRDLATGLLQCNDNTAALMASYIVQGDCGDYVEEDYPTHAYLSSYKFFPHQNSELERKIMENHKKHVGQSPAEADLNLLETARRCDLYGIKMHPSKDIELVPLNLAVAHMGIIVFQNYTKINTFSWAKIRKLSFKRKRFLIKLHPEGYGYYKDTVEFYFDGRNECKSFWKKCVEHHGFFRCSTIKRSPRHKTKILSRGSSFRYSGKTQKQMIEFVRENFVRRQSFQRSHSFRHSNSIHSSVANVGTSVSAQPLLPLSDNMLNSAISQSCGSMTLSSKADPQSPSHTVDFQDFDHKEIDVSFPNSRPGTMSQDTSSNSSPQRYIDRYHDDLSSPIKGNYSSSGASNTILIHPEANNREKQTSHIHQEIIPSSNNSFERQENKENLILNDVSGETKEENCDENYNDKIEINTISVKDATKDRMVYHIFKDLLNNERTYKKDLEVLNLWFRDEVSKEEGMPEDTLSDLFNLIDPLHELHSDLLKDLEHRYRTWEKKSSFLTCSFGDLFLNKLPVLKVYEPYVSSYFDVLEKICISYRQNKKFEQVYLDFELQKICYQPLNMFILRPLYRLFHYQAFFEKLVNVYTEEHCDSSCSEVFSRNIQTFTEVVDESLTKSENFVKLFELQRDIVGVDNLIQPERKFIREGSVYKSSPKGSQQRMLFLFSDILLYGSRACFPQFKLHNQISLRGLMLESVGENNRIPHSFTIYGGQRVLVLIANSNEEKELWVKDITAAIESNKDKIYHRHIEFDSLTMKSSCSMDEVSEQMNEQNSPGFRSFKMSVKSAPELNCTTSHVCWHRRTVLGFLDMRLPLMNLMSGFLLRKFKNNKGWQRLWVVYSNFCLFFYKSYHDDLPLACLPLLGYKLSVPLPCDKIEKNNVFKLEFRGHMYFFCAESDYPFRRWMDVIQSVTSINTLPKIHNGNGVLGISNTSCSISDLITTFQT